MNRILTILFLILAFSVRAEYTKKAKSKEVPALQFRAAECTAPTSRIDLDINNVRTTILNGGDMFCRFQSQIQDTYDPWRMSK